MTKRHALHPDYFDLNEILGFDTNTGLHLAQLYPGIFGVTSLLRIQSRSPVLEYRRKTNVNDD